MSACGEFAEHVWKPGSCKNCFHPRSAHPATGGSIAPACLRVSQAGEEEDGVSVPSPYSKPTIAVRPTMMLNTDANETLADLGVSLGQVGEQLCHLFISITHSHVIINHVHIIHSLTPFIH